MIFRYGLVLIGFLLVWMNGVLTQKAEGGMIGPPVAVHSAGTLAGEIEGGIINRDLVLDSGGSPEIRMSNILFRGTYGIVNWANAFLTLGMMDDDFKVSNFQGTQLTFLAKPSIAYGAGFKVTVYEVSQFLLGGGGRYERFTLNSERSTNTSPPADAELTWQEFRFFAGAYAKGVPYFAPYGGFYVTLLQGELNFSRATPSGADVEEDQPVGLFYGGDFNVWPNWVFSAEIRLIAESSIAFSLQYKFR